MKRRNERKASLLYDYLADQRLFSTPVGIHCRSLMNVLFTTGDGRLDEKFATEAEAAGLYNLRGLCAKGGLCASIYNAMPIEGVQALVECLKKFEQERN